MNKFLKFCSIILVISLFALVIAAQTNGLPRFGKGESYAKVRVKMLKAGWKPFHSPDADKCYDGDERCEGRPEMQNCAGTGLAPCRFLWKRKGKTVIIFTSGENTIYNGYEYEK
jgi:hypothetical protein